MAKTHYDDHEYIVVQRINNPPIPDTKPVLVTAPKRYHVRCTSRIQGEISERKQDTAPKPRIESIERTCRFPLVADGPDHASSGVIP